MASKSKKQDKTAVEAPASTEVPTTKVTTTEKAELSTNHNSSLAFQSSDMELPRMNIVQKMSEIDGPIGSVVIDKEDVILEAGQKHKVVVLGAIKRFKEDIPYDDDAMPKFVDTQAEADALADESEFGVIEFAELILLIPQVGDDEDAYPYLIGDTNYQLGKMTVQKDAYRFTYKRLWTFNQINLSVNVSSIFWSFSSEAYSKGKYSWFVPMLSSTKDPVPQEVLDFAERIRSAS